MDSMSRLRELMQTYFELGDGPARVSVMEQAVREADALGDESLQFRMRIQLCQAAFDGGRPEVLLTALTWCVAKFDPEFHDHDLLLNACDKALAYVSYMPSISKQQVHQLQDDVEQRYRKQGVGERTMFWHRCSNAFWMGEIETAKENHRKMLAAPLDSHSPDPYWERLLNADVHLHAREWEKAFEYAEPALVAEHDSRGAFPWIASFMLLPLIRLDKQELADRSQRRSYPDIKDNPKHITLIGNHLGFLAARGELARGVQMLERHFGWSTQPASHGSVFPFYVGMTMLCRRVLAESPGTRFHFPTADLPFSGEECDVASALALSEEHSDRVARELDDRNGNDYYKETKRIWLELIN